MRRGQLRKVGLRREKETRRILDEKRKKVAEQDPCNKAETQRTANKVRENNDGQTLAKEKEMRVTESNRQYRQKTAGMAVKGKQEIIERKIHFCSRQRKPAGAGERRQSLDLEEERRRRTVNNDDINVLQ